MLRLIPPGIKSSYQVNKKFWNAVILDGSITQDEIVRMIDNSFMLVVSKMTKKDQQLILVHF